MWGEAVHGNATTHVNVVYLDAEQKHRDTKGSTFKLSREKMLNGKIGKFDFDYLGVHFE